MSRFGSLVLAGVCSAALALGCGEKDLPSDPNSTGGAFPGGMTSTGGTTVAPLDDAGATTAVDSGDPVTPTGPVYKNDIDLFLTKYCSSCHSADGVSPPMDTYATAKSSADSSNKTLVAGTMPPGSKQPTAAEKARFAEWVKAGSPQ
jgi:hypothetical protein